MNVLVGIDHHFNDVASGGGRVASDIADVLRARSHTLAFVCMQVDPTVSESTLEQRDGVRIVRYSLPPTPSWHPHRANRRIAAAARAIEYFLGSESWDIAHLHSTLTGCGVLEALGTRTAYVTTIHSPATLEQRINWRTQGLVGHFKLAFGLGQLRELEQRIMAASRAVHVLSEFTRGQLTKEHDLSTPVHVIPHWRRPELQRTLTRAQARQRLGWPDDRPVLLTVRRHTERMGLDVAIRALAPLVKRRPFLFVVAGEGPLRPKLQSLAATLGASEDTIVFPGRLSEQQLMLAYQAADLFVLPTRALECFGIITLEALCFGCPVIGTDAGATPELLDPLAPDFVVPAGDVRALRSKVEAFLAGALSPPDERTIAEYVSRHYDREVVTPRITALIEGAAARTAVSVVAG